MIQQAKVLDFQVDMLTVDALNQQIDEYCDKEQMMSILFLSVPIVEQAMDSYEYHEKITKFHMLIPGEKEVFLDESAKIFRENKLVFDETCFGEVLKMLEESERSIYIAGDQLDKIEILLRYCEEEYPDLRVVGSYIVEKQIDDEKLLNDINTSCPDVIITAIAPKCQEEWIINNTDKLNGKVCIGADVLITKVTERYRESQESGNYIGMYHNFVKIKRTVEKNIQKGIFSKECKRYMKKL